MISGMLMNGSLLTLSVLNSEACTNYIESQSTWCQNLSNRDNVGSQPVEGESSWETLGENEKQWREPIHQHLKEENILFTVN